MVSNTTTKHLEVTMSNKKQSSVEWFNEELKHLVDRHGYVSKKMLSIHFNRAKVMHKDEVVQTFEKAYLCGYKDNGDGGIDYYNETFGGNNG